MSYEFIGCFTSSISKPAPLPESMIWRDIDAPFVGVGVKLLHWRPTEHNLDDVQSILNVTGMTEAARWIYLEYVCWGGGIDSVYGLGSHNGESFGPFYADEMAKVDGVFGDLMSRFGVALPSGNFFEPFVRGYWGDQIFNFKLAHDSTMTNQEHVAYPFRPRSTAALEPGQFWAVPLPNRRFACGRIVQVGGSEIPIKSRDFFGGLLDWSGDLPPSHESIANASMLEWGVMHIRSITNLGGEILGCRPLDADGICPPVLLSSMGGDGARILCGADSVRPANRDEWGKYPVLGFWGWDYIQRLAIHRFVPISN